MTSSPRRIELFEHESREEQLSAPELRGLLDLKPGTITIAPTGNAGSYLLTASSKVGLLAFDDLELVIRPKIPLENVFLLMEPARVAPELRSELVGYGDFEELLPAFAGFFTRLLEHTLLRGMRRAYQPMEESLVAMRGRVRLERQMRSPLVTPIECAFDEYTVDTPHNRLIKAAAVRLLQIPAVGLRNRDALRHLLMWFGDVSDTPPPVRTVLKQGFTRLDTHYEPIVRLACLVLENASLSQDAGGLSAHSFIVDMNRVFEAFLEVRLGESLRGRLDVRGQASTYLDCDRQVRMKPDLLFSSDGAPVFVGDAKYKVTTDVYGVESDLYQLLAYTTALDLPEGVLIYAQAEEDVPPASLRVAETTRRLHVRRIDLSGDARSIRTELAELADWIDGRVRGNVVSMRSG